VSQSQPAGVGPTANAGVSFALGSETYRLLRLDAEWRQSRDEVRVPPEEAVAIIEQATRQQHWNRDVVYLFETAASQIAGLHEGGVFVLLRRERFDSDARSVARTPSSTPSAVSAPAPPEPPVLEEPVMGADQAVVLKNAAASGTPFCEECARAAAARQGTPTAA
jgi:hypothetical protein